MTHAYWLRNVRPFGGAAEDFLIRDGVLAERRPASAAPLAAGDVDGGGQLMTRPLVESHIHLDKTLWGQPWRPNSAGPALKDYIANERRVLREVEAPIAARAGALLENCIARGSLTLRCHVDIDPEFGLSHVEAMQALREGYRDLIHLELVAFPQTGLVSRPGTAELMRQALALGVENVGGLDPCGIDNDPIAQLDIVFGLAAEFDRGVDIHLHDKGELGLWQIARIADYTERFGRQGRVMISHAYCLGMAPWSQVEPLARRLAELGISLMSSAPADCAVPPFLALRAAGVNLCLGSDGIRDAWSPMGNGDMLERAMLLAFRFDLAKDDELAAAFDAASLHGSRALGRAGQTLAPGGAADFLLMEAQSLGEAVVARPPRRVYRAGRLIAEQGRLLESRL
ncbi:amidohydrolase family protein [Metapseudomonas furukawaii]|uniref:Cytosine deaminase n=1 Tax=Metapseudomonas furukawaii TaxID=1149133 RepID=A0AAD1BU02_METFU|nr:amidohydrolase family protein [Pseudomonas furukawaii]ELS25716.1 Cytosine deaminase [Pseudomonas furukawaii]BAU72154.1 cytosine deaminase [Pseudomonas furukawaii]